MWVKFLMRKIFTLRLPFSELNLVETKVAPKKPLHPDSMNVGKSSQIRKNGFGSLPNPIWTCYHNTHFLLRHWLRFTKKLTKLPLIHCIAHLCGPTCLEEPYIRRSPFIKIHFLQITVLFSLVESYTSSTSFHRQHPSFTTQRYDVNIMMSKTR